VVDNETLDDLCSSIVFIHDTLKKERLHRGLTQKQLANEMGVSVSSISLLESGSNVTLLMIKKYLLCLKGFDIRNKNEKTKP